ncbi:TetR family transcriptional regulator [Streptomyces sp. NPDC001691]|uniref:TetR/AcrR family transcriptional regulator n=1 Tax=unclassified Streptomyces TaxID=2593676 RepID=UPI00167A4483|nr:TetR/AcrR family transcriptional regulator [Streptomyces sp. SDr-06]
MMDDVATDSSTTSTTSTPGSSRSAVAPGSAEKPRRTRRTRMTGAERREQLLDIGRTLFAEKGFEGTSVEEIAAKAGVSKPVVYEHFGGKEGLYAVVVDREMRSLLDMVTSALTAGHPRELLEQAAFALLDYIETYTDGFRILVRDSPVAQSTGTFASLISDIATQVEDILGLEFKARGFDPKLAPLYAQALVGMVALTGQWWLDVRKPKKAEVAAHLVNLAWHGLDGLEPKPRLIGHRKS